VEFLSAVLTSRRGFYSPMLYVLEALRNGARFLAPDLNESDAKRFLTQGETVRLPLDQVKGLTAKTLEKLVDGRPYADAGEFYRKARPARDEWLALLKSGTLDGLGEPRGRLFWRLQRLEASTKKGGAEPWVNGELPESFEAGVETRAKWEVETLGFPVSLHPLECFGPKVAWKNYVTVARLTERQSEFYGKTVRVCGLVVADRHHPTAQGTMKFLTLADWTGFVEVSLFAKTYREYGHLTVKPVLSVEATVDSHDNRKGFSLSGVRVA
jgi:DNA polymerase-3 subunit alpha